MKKRLRRTLPCSFFRRGCKKRPLTSTRIEYATRSAATATTETSRDRLHLSGFPTRYRSGRAHAPALVRGLTTLSASILQRFGSGAARRREHQHHHRRDTRGASSGGAVASARWRGRILVRALRAVAPAPRSTGAPGP